MIRGQPWKVRWPARINNGRYYGLCAFDLKQIDIEATLTGRKLLEIAIHEPLHAEFPAATEAQVTQAARDIADALWRMGFRCD